MIKVLVVQTTGFGYDGITSVVTNYYTYQNADRIYMDVVTINPVSENFKIQLSGRSGQNFVLPYRNRNPLKYVAELSRILKNGKYDILHAHGCSATMAVEMLAAKISGVKIRIAHSHNTTCDHVKVDRLLRPLFSHLCNVRFACSKEAGEWLFPGESVHVIQNGIDIEKYRFRPEIRDAFRKVYDLRNKIVVGHVGRFSLQKNHQRLLEIFKDFSKATPEACLVLIGAGELRSQMETQANEAGLNVLFAGLSNEVEKWLQAMDVFVFPSLFEGLPLGLVEAQAAGLPCILSNTVSPAAQITDLVEFVGLDEDNAVWCAAISRALEKSDRETHGPAVLSQICQKQFDIQKNCEALADLYESFILSRPVKEQPTQ